MEGIKGLVMLLTQGVLYCIGDFCLLLSLPFPLSIPREGDLYSEIKAEKRNPLLHAVYTVK